MNNAYQLQSAIGLLASIAICAAWWYAAIKFPRVWIFSGLAIVSTISILLYAGTILLLAVRESSTLVLHLSRIQMLLRLVDAVLYILLVRWLVLTFKDREKL